MNWISLCRLFGVLLLAVTVISCAASSRDVAKVLVGNDKSVVVGKVDFEKLPIPDKWHLWPDSTTVVYRAVVKFSPSPSFCFSRKGVFTYKLNFSFLKQATNVEEVILYSYPEDIFRYGDRKVIYHHREKFQYDNAVVAADFDLIPKYWYFIEVRVRFSGYPHSISVSHEPGGRQGLEFFEFFDDKTDKTTWPEMPNTPK